MPDTEVPAQPCSCCGGTGQLALDLIENTATGQVTSVSRPCAECLPC